MASQNHHRPSASAEDSRLLLRALLTGLLAFLLLALGLLFASAFLCLRLPDPSRPLFPLSLGILLLSTFMGGLFAARQYGKASLPVGLLIGGILFFLTWVIALCLPSTQTELTLIRSFLLRLFIPVFSTFGAFCGVHLKKRRKRRR